MVKGNRTAGLSLLLIGIGSFEAIYLSKEGFVYKIIRYTKVYTGNRGFIAHPGSSLRVTEPEVDDALLRDRINWKRVKKPAQG